MRQTLARILGKPAAPAAPRAPVKAETRYLSDLKSWDQLFGNAGNGLIVTPEKAATYSAVFAAIRLIAGSIAMLPLHTYERVSDDERRRASLRLGGMLAARPNPRLSAIMFWRTTVASMLMRGNGYAWVQRQGGGEVYAIWPIPAARVRPRLVDQGQLKGRIVYEVTTDEGDRVAVDQDDMLHFPGTVEWRGAEALSPIAAYADAVGIGIRANDYAARYFDNDATPPGYIAYPEGKKVESREQAEEIVAYWNRTLGGENRHKIGLLTEGAKFEQLTISAGDAQLLESRRFQIEDVARVFGVPPHLIGAVDKTTSWGSGLEEQTNGFLLFTLGMHLAAIEAEINWKLFRGSPFFAEYERRALVSLNVEQRFKAYGSALGGSSGPGWMTPNEVRKRENMAAHPDGDRLTGWEQAPADAGADGETDR